MKNIKNTVIILLVLALFLLSACSQSDGPGATKIDYLKAQGLSQGTYILEEADDSVFEPKISFDFHNETFLIVFDSYTSYWNHGKFEAADKIVTCKTYDEKYTYTFKIDDEAIIFIQDSSAKIELDVDETLSTVVDGAKFLYNETTVGVPTGEYVISEIVDKTVNSDISTGSALQKFYEDEKYTYSYPSIKSEYVIVKFQNGTEMTAAEALKKGYVSISHLDAWDIKYIKERKDTFSLEINVDDPDAPPPYYSTLGHLQTIYEETPSDQIENAYANGELVVTKLHYMTQDKEWYANGYTYKYRLEITGRLNNAEKSTTYIVLSNTEDITFEQAWKASGLSSNTDDYFKPEEAVIVGNKVF